MDQLPITGGFAVVAIVIAYRLLTERSEIRDLHNEVHSLNEKVSKLEVLYDDQRKEKHRLANELTKANMLLGIILGLAEKCTCHALDLVEDLLRRAAAPIEPPPYIEGDLP